MSLRNFVTDHLYSISGFADDAVVDFVLALTKKAKDAPSLARKLVGASLPPGPQTAAAVDARDERGGKGVGQTGADAGSAKIDSTPCASSRLSGSFSSDPMITVSTQEGRSDRTVEGWGGKVCSKR